MIIEKTAIFDHLCEQLTQLAFPSNLTRPSRQYDTVSRLSKSIFKIRHELSSQISVGIFRNRPETQHILSKIEEICKDRPYVRMLGDEYDTRFDVDETRAQHVRQLNTLLSSYMNNSLSANSYYDQLSKLPDDFIVLGLNLARDYETREVLMQNGFERHYASNTMLTRNPIIQHQQVVSDTTSRLQTTNRASSSTYNISTMSPEAKYSRPSVTSLLTRLLF